MPVSPAELSSIASELEELTRRISAAAAEAAASKRDDVATGLYEVERSLTTAARRMAPLVSGGRRARRTR